MPRTGGVFERLKRWASALKRDVIALWLAVRHRSVAWPAKLVAAAVAAYALSPIDLIPDFVPVLGYLDDLIIVPAGVWLAVRLIAPALMIELRRAALRRERPRSHWGVVIVLAIWVIVGSVFADAMWPCLFDTPMRR